MYYDLMLSYYLPTADVAARDEGFAIQRNYYDYQDYLKIQTLKSQERDNYLSGSLSYDDLKYPQMVTAYLTPVQTIKIGQLLVVDNQIIATETRDKVMFEGFLPAGAEAINTSLATSQKLNIQSDSTQQAQLSQNGFVQINTIGDLFTRVEFRADRVMGYTSVMYPGVHHFLYVVRAGYAGQFGINPSMISQINTPEVFGRTAGQVMKIE